MGVLCPLQRMFAPNAYPAALVDVGSPDEAAVFGLTPRGRRLTVGFFTPVLDCPCEFGTLGAATVGIASTDAAIEAADIALMADDLAKVAYAIRLGRQARWISQQDIAFSLLILAALIPSAPLGLLGLALAVTVHEVTELLAMGNGLQAARV